MQIKLFDLFLLNYLRGMKTDKEESRGQYGQTFAGLMAHVQGGNLTVDRKTVFYIVKYGLNCKLVYQCAGKCSPVCMHIALCEPGVVTWGDAKTKELSDQYITFSN